SPRGEAAGQVADVDARFGHEASQPRAAEGHSGASREAPGLSLSAMRHRALHALAFVTILSLSCRGREAANPADRVAPAAPSPSGSSAAQPAPQAAGPRVVFLGDSLTAGLGVSEETAFPARVGE